MENPERKKITFHTQNLQIKEELKHLFPTLLSKDMPYLEMKRDPNGQLLASAKPLRVSGFELTLLFRLELYFQADRRLVATT